MGKGGFEPPYHMDLIYSQARLTSYATSPVWAVCQVPPCLLVSLSFAENFKDLVEMHGLGFHSCRLQGISYQPVFRWHRGSNPVLWIDNPWF